MRLLVSSTLNVSAQPTPQYGHSESTLFTLAVAVVGFCVSSSRNAFIVGPPSTVRATPAGTHRRNQFVGQRTGRTNRHALATRYAGTAAHRRIEIERDACAITFAGSSDDVVMLQLVASAHALVAQDAGLVIDVDHRGRRVATARTIACAIGEGNLVDAKATRECEQLIVAGCLLASTVLGVVGQKQLGQHLAMPLHFRRAGVDLHPVLARPHTRRRHNALADVDHAQAEHPDRSQARTVAEHRNLDTGLSGGIPNRGALGHGHIVTVDGELNEFRCAHRDSFTASAPNFGRISSGKLLMTLITGASATWPSPQIDVCTKVEFRSANSSTKFAAGRPAIADSTSSTAL